MHVPRHRRPIVPLAIAVVLMATLFAGPVGAVGATPTIKMFVSAQRVTVARNAKGFVQVDPGAYVTPVGADFKLVVSRPDYDTPVSVKQVDPDTGAVLRTFSADNLDGWLGLNDFTHFEVVDAQGETVASGASSFCPNAYSRARLSDESPLVPTYPYQCGSAYAPFTRGSVWGIDDGWAAPLIGNGYYYGGGQVRWKAKRNSYTVKIQIDPAWVDRLSITQSDAIAEVRVTVVDRGTLRAERPTSPVAPAARPFPSTPIVTQPDPDTLPDLIALPGWGMSTGSRRGHDYLSFNATEWNAGPGMLLIDGFRNGDEPTLDAFEYFVRDGEPIGRALIGQLHFHAGRHNHWHFEQFTQYTLLDAAKTQVQVSDKQSWCLAPTDGIDLSVPNANWGQLPLNVYSQCGYGQPGALWVRETLPVGWGDTYGQGVNFGAFDITNLPNGTYYVRTHVNPTGSILEGTQDNNIEDRLIKLRGKPGHRRVLVPPWHGIDTENYCNYCG